MTEREEWLQNLAVGDLVYGVAGLRGRSDWGIRRIDRITPKQVWTGKVAWRRSDGRGVGFGPYGPEIRPVTDADREALTRRRLVAQIQKFADHCDGKDVTTERLQRVVAAIAEAGDD
jgi:hypothetical protein